MERLSIFLIFVILAIQTQAQQLTLRASVIDDVKNSKAASVVNIYRYASSVQSSVLVDHRTVKHNAQFKFELALEHGYVMEVVSSNGSYKRVIVNTETMPYPFVENCQFEVEIDVRPGVKWGREPEDIAWVFYNPMMGEFAFSEEVPNGTFARN